MPFIKFEITKEERELLDFAAANEYMKTLGWIKRLVLITARNSKIQNTTLELQEQFKNLDLSKVSEMINSDDSIFADNPEMLKQLEDLQDKRN